MVKYRIPEQYKKGLSVISTMTLEQVQAFCEAVEDFKGVYNLDSLIKDIQQQALLDSLDIYNIVHAIYSLIELIAEAKTTIEDLAIDIIDSFQAVQPSTEQLNDQQKKQFQNNLTQILGQTPKIKLIIKANNLISDYDKVYSNSKILTDIRFILSEKISDAQQAAVIVHQLKVEFVQNGEAKHSFYAMDINDLRKLKIIIDRAIEKESTIRSGHYFNSLNFIELSNQS